MKRLFMQMGEIKDRLSPRGIWTMRPNVKDVFTQEITRLPKSKNVDESESRYPTTSLGLQEFMNRFFARHYFQIQESILQKDNYKSFYASINKGMVNIADVGCGPAVAGLAIMDMIDVAHDISGLPRIKFNLILNDIASISLRAGTRMLHSLAKNVSDSISLNTIVSIDTPFPRSMVQLRRFANLVNPYDLCFMSYVLIPLKQNMTHDDIQVQIRELMKYCSPHGLCVILQDKFRESLIRQTGRLQGASTHKATLRQKVYDQSNPNAEQIYSFYRTIIKPETKSNNQGVLNRLCLQNRAVTLCR